MRPAAGAIDSWISNLAETRGFRVRLADGRHLGAPANAAAFTMILRTHGLLPTRWGAPSALRLGQAWIDGRLDLEGDIFAAMEVLHAVESSTPSPWMRTIGLLRRRTAKWRNSASDIASHYDLPAAFYELFLDERMVYTCAYYRADHHDLEQAQRDKLDLVCRKLRLSRNETLLDLGCGWGGLSCWAAAHYGVRVHGVTLSREQASWAAATAGKEGLGDRVTIEHLDYRSLPAGRRYDKIAAVGVIEHVGRDRYPAYFQRIRGLLCDGGLFLNHGITMRAGASWSSEMEFLHRHVFPGLDLVDVATTLSAMERSGLEVLDVEGLRPHYARTTRTWAERLWHQRDRACAVAGERVWRTWVAYLAAASVAFDHGWIGLHQVVASRPMPAGEAAESPRREDVYRAWTQEARLHSHQARPSAATAARP